MIIRIHVRARHAASALALAALAALAMPVGAKTIEYAFQVLESPNNLRLDGAALSPLGEQRRGVDRRRLPARRQQRHGSLRRAQRHGDAAAHPRRRQQQRDREDGQFATLPTFDSSPASVSGVNAAGVAAGLAGDAPQRHASGVIWRNGTITELDKLVDISDNWRIAEGIAINDAGQILVMGYDPKGNSNGMVLTPIAH